MTRASLFAPASLGKLALKNHLVMAPMTRSRAVEANTPNALMAEHYRQRATAGLIITEGTSPSPNGTGYPRIPGLWSAGQVAGWKLVTDAVHAGGGRIVVQLMQEALAMLEQLKAREAKVGVIGNRQYNNGWHTAMDLRNLLMVSEAIARSAILRKESRGAQFREDYPNKDAEWGKYNLITRQGASGEMIVEKRPVMEQTGEMKQIVEEMK